MKCYPRLEFPKVWAEILQWIATAFLEGHERFFTDEIVYVHVLNMLYHIITKNPIQCKRLLNKSLS